MTFVLDRGLSASQGPDGLRRLQPDRSYWNNIGPFGGWTAALLMKAMLEDAQAEHAGMQPVSQTVDYMTGLKDDPLEVAAGCDRSGRSTQFRWASLRAEGAATPAVRSSAVFGLRRPTRSFTERRMPDVPAAQDLPRLDFPTDRVAWPAVYDMRVARGRLFSSADDMHSLTWIREADGRPLDFVSLAALVDTSFPRIYYRIGSPTPFSTVSMTSYFHATDLDLAEVGGGFVLVETAGKRAGGGFSDQHADFWSADGRLLAVSQQLAWFDLPA
ncbi:MAG: thioesterase family protein [Sneathiellaceae bacterium]